MNGGGQATPAAGVVTVDLHGKSVYQARVAVDAALRRAGGGVYRLRLVHGCHLGTGIRDMVRSEYAAHPAVKRLLCESDGVTALVLRELV